ncbi:MAG: hypothetical protein GEV08_22705 [Acidimicrobiia bacterium]|nr:hypothetical protein [Acidimicrobiia bacterium]
MEKRPAENAPVRRPSRCNAGDASHGTNAVSRATDREDCPQLRFSRTALGTTGLIALLAITSTSFNSTTTTSDFVGAATTEPPATTVASTTTPTATTTETPPATAVPPPATTTVPNPVTFAPTSQSATEDHFLALTNTTRASAGRSPLQAADDLHAYAAAHAQAMAEAGSIYHSNTSSLLGPWRAVGENVGVGPSAQAIHDAFVASPSHYANIVDSSYTSMGVGVVVDANGRVWTAHVFGA